MKANQAWRAARQAAAAWSADRAPSMGAALSYYTVFSIAPLLLIVISVAGMVFGVEAAQGAIVDQLQGLLGERAAQTIQSLLQSVAKPKQGIVATVIGVALLLLGATTVLAELQSDLDLILKAPQRAKPSGLWGWLRLRLLSFGMILGIGFLLMVSLVMSAAISALGHWWGPLFGAWEATAHAVDLLLSYVLITVMFALIYRFMPDVKMAWRDVWLGAAVTALLFALGKFLIGLYIGKSTVVSGFGAAGSLAVLLLWVYYSAQIFLLGAEFTRVVSEQHRAGQAPSIATDTAPSPPAPARVSTQPGVAMRRSEPQAKPMGKVASVVQRHWVPAVGAAAALGALTAWGVQRLRAARQRGISRMPRQPATPRAAPVAPADMAGQSTRQFAKGVAKGAASAVLHSTLRAMTRGLKRGATSSAA